MKFLLFCFLLVHCLAYSYSKDFSQAALRPYVHKWEGRLLNLQEEKRLDEILSQRFQYMNAGTQSTVFISEDGKYILKFFKQRQFTPRASKNTWSIPFFARWRKEKQEKKYALKRDKIFSAYKVSFDRLSKQTGVIYVHFNSGRLKRSIQLENNVGQLLTVRLDDWDFVIEQRAEPLPKFLESLLKKGDVHAAEEAISSLLDLHRIFFEKGMRNRDIEFASNYGFIDGAPVLFDVGRLLPAVGWEGREKVLKKLKNFLPAFRMWIDHFYPILLPACDAAIVKLNASFDNPAAFSMTSFHPYQIQWEPRTICNENKRDIEAALSQPYRYLGKGGQSIAFVSADDKFVVKFFKQKIFSVPQEVFSKQRKLKQRAGKRDRIYTAYKLACDVLSKETGIFYVHFNTTSHLQKTLRLTLASGAEMAIELDDCDFIIERRAVRLVDHLDTLLAQGKVVEAGESLRNVLEMHCVFFKRHVRDRDRGIKHNFGFVDGAPVLFDVGRLVPCIGQQGKKEYQKRMQSSLPRFRNWIKAHYPQLLPYCDAGIAKILETIYT